jgi:hypothetical protein
MGEVCIMTPEKKFQNYFMKLVNGYRTALVTGGGFPDTLLILEEKHFLVELKVLKIGPSGDKMLRGCYTEAQMPWHLDYLQNKKGKSLYTVFKIIEVSQDSIKYGVVLEDEEYCMAVLNSLKYKGLRDFMYKEYKTLKELIEVEFE